MTTESIDPYYGRMTDEELAAELHWSHVAEFECRMAADKEREQNKQRRVKAEQARRGVALSYKGPLV